MFDFLKKFFKKKESVCVAKEPEDFFIESLDVYQEEAFKTFKGELAENREEALKYLALKLAEETGEITGPIAKHFYHGKPLDLEELKGEYSDCLWYISNLAKISGFTLSEVATHNIEKLRKRHGEKFRKEYYTK